MLGAQYFHPFTLGGAASRSALATSHGVIVIPEESKNDKLMLLR